MTQRVARILLIAFLAGPAVNGRCLFSCAAVEHVVLAETCHGVRADGPAFATGDDCGVDPVSLSPFLKAPDRPQVTPALLTSLAGIDLELALSRSFVAAAVGHGPPFVRTPIPLRI
jgi:hypothetical protein